MESEKIIKCVERTLQGDTKAFEELYKASDINIDTDIDTIVQQNNVADKITSIQNGNYDDKTEESTDSGFNLDGFY